MIRSLRTVVLLVVGLLPWPLKRALLCRLFGWQLHHSSRIGMSIFLNVEHVQLADGATIGHFNVFLNLRHLELGSRASIGHLNWITVGYTFADGAVPARYGYLVLGAQSAIVTWHYIDCMGGVAIGAFSTIAGAHSTILSHQIDVQIARQSLRPVHIGDYCLVSSDVRVVPGARIPERCVIAMGAVVAGELPEPGMLYGGVPARRLKDVSGAYFTRKTGAVPW